MVPCRLNLWALMPVWFVMSDPPDVSRETSFFSCVGFSRDAQSTSPGSVSHSGRFQKTATWSADLEGPSASWGRLEDSGTAPDRTRVNCTSVGPRRSSHVAARRRGPSGSSSVFHVEHDASLQLGVSGQRDRSSTCLRAFHVKHSVDLAITRMCHRRYPSRRVSRARNRAGGGGVPSGGCWACRRQMHLKADAPRRSDGCP